MVRHHSEDHAGASAAQARSETAAGRTSRLKLNERGIWEVHYSAPDETGAWRGKRFSTKTKDPTTAEEIFNEWLNYVHETNATQIAQRQPTISELLDAYLQGKRFPAGSSIFYIVKPLHNYLGGLTPQLIDDRRLANYRMVRRNARNNEDVSDGTLRRELGALIAALNYGAKQRLFDRADLPRITLPKQSEPRVLWLDKDQEEAFWRAAQAAGGELALFVALGLDTAARKGAILGLTWERIDLVRKLIDFREPGRAVSRKRRVVVPISTRLLPVLQQAAQLHGRLFSSKLRTTFGTFTRRIGMEWVTPHVMRHTWASLAAQDGVPMLHIAKMLGDTQATVERTYAHLQPGHLHDVVNRRWSGAA